MGPKIQDKQWLLLHRAIKWLKVELAQRLCSEGIMWWALFSHETGIYESMYNQGPLRTGYTMVKGSNIFRAEEQKKRHNGVRISEWNQL